MNFIVTMLSEICVLFSDFACVVVQIVVIEVLFVDSIARFSHGLDPGPSKNYGKKGFLNSIFLL